MCWTSTSKEFLVLVLNRIGPAIASSPFEQSDSVMVVCTVVVVRQFDKIGGGAEGQLVFASGSVHKATAEPDQLDVNLSSLFELISDSLKKMP